MRQLQEAQIVTHVAAKRGPHAQRCIYIPRTPPQCKNTPFFIPDIHIPLLKPEVRKGKVIPALFDLHIPHEDQRALQIVLSILNGQKWDGLILGGDIMSFGQIGRYRITHPQTVTQLQQDCDHGAGILKLLKQVTPNLDCADRIFIPGNHDWRFSKHLLDYSPASTMLRSNRLTEQLKLKENGFSLLYDPLMDVPKKRKHVRLTERFMVTHGAKEDGSRLSSISAYSARANLQKWGISGASGHSHRMGVHYKTDEGGERAWHECGCLINPAKVDWAESPNWQHGFPIFYIWNGTVHVELVRIINYEARFNGRLYKA